MKTVGEVLRSERMRRGLAIKDAQQVLHIKEAYLAAIEEANYEEIPGNVYVKGFIRNYAQFLGLDGQEIVNAYKREIGENIFVPVLKKTKVNKRKEEREKEKKVHKKLSYEGRVKKRQKRIFRERLIVGAFVFFILLFIIYLFFF